MRTLMILSLGLMFFATHTWAALNPEAVFIADSRKTNHYVRDGLITGGDRAINDIVVQNIRHSRNQGYERVVIDIQGNRSGEPAAVERPPYFQVEVSPEMKRVIFTVWGKPKVGFDAKKILTGFTKTNVFSEIELLPVLEKDRWSFVMNLKKGHSVEVFELKNPVRVILDFKSH